MISTALLIIYISVLVILVITGFVLTGTIKGRGSVARALNLSLFRITLPKETVSNSGQQKSDKELISVMEQLYSSISNIHSSGWNKFVYGEPYIALELSVHHVGEEINFYIAVPSNYKDVFEKQVHGVFPLSDVTHVHDYNIFNPHGASVGGYLSLTSDPILPIRSYQHLESDALGSILTSLSKLEKEGEGAAIQILIRPSRNNRIKNLAQKVAKEMQSGLKFSAAVYASKHPKKEKDDSKPEQPRVVTPFEEEIIKGVQAKASKPLFDTNIRIIVSAPDESRAEQLFNEIGGSFVQFSAAEMNGLKVNKVKSRSLDKLIFNFSFRVFDNDRVMALSSEEIASMYHFPLATTLAPRIKFLKAKPAEPPPNLPQSGIGLGFNIYRGRETLIRMADKDRSRHLYVIGQTGTGKSVFMESLIRQDIAKGKGVCVIDPHGEFAEFVLSVVPKERIDDVIYFDPGDTAQPMGLNMLEIDPMHPEQKSMVIDELFGIFDKLYDLKTTGGPMFEKYFKNAAYLLLDDYEHEIPVLADISRVLVDDAYRADKLSRESNPLVKQFWQLEAEKAGGDQSLANMAPYISSKITSFVYNEFLRPIINQQVSAFNFRRAMDEGKILIVNLSKGKIGDLNANLLGMIIIGKLLMAALSRIDITDENARRDFYLYIDEFQNFTTESIGIILSEARKYHLNLIIAHQFIKQLKENIRDSVFGNVGSIVSFRIGPDDAEYMKNKFEPVFTPSDLMNIDNLNSYVNLLIDGQTSRPFSMRVLTELVFGAGSKEYAEKLRQISRLRYGKPREEVEDQIKAKYVK